MLQDLGATNQIAAFQRYHGHALRNNGALSLNIARPAIANVNNRQARAAQYKLYVTSRKTANYCIPAEQLNVREVTRPPFPRAEIEGSGLRDYSVPTLF